MLSVRVLVVVAGTCWKHLVLNGRDRPMALLRSRVPRESRLNGSVRVATVQALSFFKPFACSIYSSANSKLVATCKAIIRVQYNYGMVCWKRLHEKVLGMVIYFK